MNCLRAYPAGTRPSRHRRRHGRRHPPDHQLDRDRPLRTICAPHIHPRAEVGPGRRTALHPGRRRGCPLARSLVRRTDASPGGPSAFGLGMGRLTMRTTSDPPKQKPRRIPAREATESSSPAGMPFRALGPFFALSSVLTWGIAALLILFPEPVEAVFGPLGYTNPCSSWPWTRDAVPHRRRDRDSHGSSRRHPRTPGRPARATPPARSAVAPPPTRRRRPSARTHPSPRSATCERASAARCARRLGARPAALAARRAALGAGRPRARGRAGRAPPIDAERRRSPDGAGGTSVRRRSIRGRRDRRSRRRSAGDRTHRDERGDHEALTRRRRRGTSHCPFHEQLLRSTAWTAGASSPTQQRWP